MASKKGSSGFDKEWKEEEAAAMAYAEFIETFQGTSQSSGPKTFIKAGLYQPTDGSETKIGDRAIYQLGKKSQPESTSCSLLLQERLKAEATAADAPSTKRPREIDSFVNELKQRQQWTEKRKQVKVALEEADTEQSKDFLRDKLHEIDKNMEMGAVPTTIADIGHAHTGAAMARQPTGCGVPAAMPDESTNLYLGNLSQNITEEFLCQQFGKYGEIKSVKIMYPRSEEEKMRGRHCGFVSFTKRISAEEAMHHLDGREFFGMPIRVGWGKPVAKPGGIGDASHGVVTNPMPLMNPEMASFVSVAPPTVVPGTSGFSDTAPQSTPAPVKITEVVPPVNSKVRLLIDILAKYVAEDGHDFEREIMQQEGTQGRFSFLSEHTSSISKYYRWRVWAYAQGDTAKVWRSEPFPMYTGGSLWKPPPVDDHTTDRNLDSKMRASSKRVRKVHEDGVPRLSQDDMDDLCELLQELSKDRNSICKAMQWCIDRADCAKEITETLANSLVHEAVTIDAKLTRLYLISDVLYNSSCSRPFAWAFRAAVERGIPDVLEHFNTVHRTVEGRLTAELMKEAVMKVLRVWEQWAVYSIDFIKGLEMSLTRKPGEFIFYATGPLSDSDDLEDDDLDGEPIVDTLAKYPEFLRPKVKEWQEMDIAQLERTCLLHGLSTMRTGDIESLLDRLIAREMYVRRELEQNQAEILDGEEDIDGVELDGDDMDIDGEELEIADGEPLQVAPPPLLDMTGNIPEWLRGGDPQKKLSSRAKLKHHHYETPGAVTQKGSKRRKHHHQHHTTTTANTSADEIRATATAEQRHHHIREHGEECEYEALTSDTTERYRVEKSVVHPQRIENEETQQSSNAAAIAEDQDEGEIIAEEENEETFAEENKEEVLAEEEDFAAVDMFGTSDEEDIFAIGWGNRREIVTASSDPPGKADERHAYEAKVRKVEAQVTAYRKELQAKEVFDPDTILLKCDERRQSLISQLEREMREIAIRQAANARFSQMKGE